MRILNSKFIFTAMTLMLVGIAPSIAQQMTVTYEAPVNAASNTQIVIPVKIENTSVMDNPLKVAALNTVFTVTGALPAGTTVSWIEDPAFASLNNLTVGTSTGPVRVRATQAPVIGEALAITVPTTDGGVLYGTMTITSPTNITFPITLTPTTTGNPTVQSTVYYNGATNSVAITMAAGGIVNSMMSNLVVGGPLPIKLNDFEATAIGKRNRVNWSTSSEYNNDVQIVEASKDGASNWRQVAKVKSRNSATGSSYEVFDNNPGLLTYYRIHSIDLDGREEYSYVISVQRESILTSRLRGISPIPANDVLNLDLEIASDMNVEYRIIDAAGKVVAANTVSLTQGNNVQTIDIATLASGSYTVILSGDTLAATEQFVKQ